MDAVLLNKAFQLFISASNLPDNTIASIVSCSTAEMSCINMKYRGTEGSTDVLSFPAASNSAFSSLENHNDNYLGEILIDINYINMHKESDNMEKEIIIVFIHGLLHLIGYDHLNTNQKIKMQAQEKIILDRILQDGLIER